MGEAAAAGVDDGYRILKGKLGTERDRERVEAVRAAPPPDATIRVDANEAWTPHEAVVKSEWLADLDVEFVEQPVPAENREGLRRVHERSALPVAADESCRTLSDVAAVADRGAPPRRGRLRGRDGHLPGPSWNGRARGSLKHPARRRRPHVETGPVGGGLRQWRVVANDARTRRGSDVPLGPGRPNGESKAQSGRFCSAIIVRCSADRMW
jgi:L-alanine-DL-glutamate epimerase-like enolase superfamily enzyme